jgi:hypothetical protein
MYKRKLWVFLLSQKPIAQSLHPYVYLVGSSLFEDRNKLLTVEASRQ